MKSIKKNAICFTIIVHWKLKLLNSWWIPSLYRLNFQQLFVYTVFLRRHRPCTDHREDSIPSVLPNCSDRNRVQWTLFTIYSTFWMEGWDWFDLQRIPVLFPGEIDILYSRVCWIWLFLLWMGFIFFLCLCFFFLKISKELAKSLRNNGTKIVANEGFTQDPAVAVKILKVRFSIATLGSSRNPPTRDEALRTSVWVATFFILLLFLDKRSYWSLDIVSLF